MVWFPLEFCKTPKPQQEVILSEYGLGKTLAQSGSAAEAAPCPRGRSQLRDTAAALPKWQKSLQKSYRNYSSPALEHIRQPFSQSWQQFPLVTSSEPWTWIAEGSHPCFGDESSKLTTCWICACKIQVRRAAAVAFLLCHPFDFQKQPQFDGWFHFPTVFLIALEFHRARESLHSARARVIPLGTLQVLSSH